MKTLITKTFPEILAEELLSVQPMTGDVSEIFKLKLSFEDKQQREIEYNLKTEELNKFYKGL